MPGASHKDMVLYKEPPQGGFYLKICWSGLYFSGFVLSTISSFPGPVGIRRNRKTTWRRMTKDRFYFPGEETMGVFLMPKLDLRICALSG